MANPPHQAWFENQPATFLTGHGMLLHQGALSFELFTGYPVTAAEIRSFLELS
jgi:shikimate 5-dehydrogenase